MGKQRMRKQRNQHKHILHIVIAFVVSSVLSSGLTVLAATGTTDSSAAPDATSSFTLENIYNRPNAGTAGAKHIYGALRRAGHGHDARPE